MDAQNITDRIIAIAADKGFEPLEDAKPTPTSELEFQGDLGMDSLDFVEIIMEVEKEFGITIYDDQATKVKYVGDLVRLVEKSI